MKDLIATGIVHDMPDEQYHNLKEFLQSTGLKKFDRSPAHYWFWRNERTVDYKESKALREGRLIHMCVLEPEKYDSATTIAPKVDKRTKEGKAQWNTFMTAVNAKGLVSVSEDEDKLCRAIRDSVQQNRTASKLLSQGKSEVSFFWNQDGIPCKCRADYYRTNGGNTMIVDLKTTTDASPEDFGKSVGNYGYAIQEIFYTMGVKAVTGKKPKGFVFIACEKEPPYAIGIYSIDYATKHKAEERVYKLLSRYKECLSTDTWPAYKDQILELTIPRWAFK